MSHPNLVFAYTGNGKGKTTAALGLAFRALANGKKVLFFQFAKSGLGKDGWKSGELLIAKKFPSLKVVAAGSGFVGIGGDEKPLSDHKKTANLALVKLKKEINSHKYDLVVADEILVALSLKLITRRDIISLINLVKTAKKPLIFTLTGRGLPESLYSKIDLITEMGEIKHPFNNGVPAIKGIDF